jgi:tRNA(Ser,Leu) C12 N-acetylase TAN1
MDWNVVVTVAAGPGHEHRLLGALGAFGRFRPTAFRDVCMGRVEEIAAFLEAIRSAREAGRPWAGFVARVIPAEQVFSFTPDTLAEQLKEAATPFVARFADGSFCVRLERRGLQGKLASADIERAVGEYVHGLAERAGRRMRTEFADPDFVIAAETLGTECGIALLTRALRERYPFVQVR